MRYLPLLIFLITNSLSGQNIDPKEYLNLLGSDLYIKTNEPYYRKTPPSAVEFTNNGVTMMYFQSSTLLECERMIPEQDEDSLLVAEEVVLDGKNASIYTMTHEYMQSAAKLVLFKSDSTCATLQFEYKKNETADFVDNLIQSVKADFESKIEPEPYYPIRFEMPDGYVKPEVHWPGMILLGKENVEFGEGASVMMTESNNFPESEYEIFASMIEERDVEHSDLFETEAYTLLVAYKDSPVPDLKMFEFLKLIDKTVVIGGGGFITDSEKLEIIDLLKSVEKR